LVFQVWAVANAGKGNGVFRVKYSNVLWERLLTNLLGQYGRVDSEAGARQRIVDDIFSLGFDNFATVKQMLDVSKVLIQEKQYQVNIDSLFPQFFFSRVCSSFRSSKICFYSNLFIRTGCCNLVESLEEAVVFDFTSQTQFARFAHNVHHFLV
jgi:hypothetical protein